MPFVSQNHKIILKVNYQFLKTIYVEFKILYVFKNLNTENIFGIHGTVHVCQRICHVDVTVGFLYRHT